MAYFTAVMARAGRSWKLRDVEIDEDSTLDDLADALRSVAVHEEPVLAVIEHEDEWFAFVRVDGDDEPRLFVSDLAAAGASPFGPLLAPAGDVDAVEDFDDEDSDGEDSEDSGDDEDEDGEERDPEEEVVAAWAGEPDLLEDAGVSGRTLRKLVEERGDDPGAVLGEVGEAAGFTELLEALR